MSEAPDVRTSAEEHARTQTLRFIAQLRVAYTPPTARGSQAPFMLVPHAGDFQDRLQLLVEDAYLRGAASARSAA